MSKFWRAHAELNIGAVISELIGTAFLTIAGIGVMVPAFVTVLGTGAGLGLAAFVLTFALMIRSGAHFNTGVTLAKAVTWASGMNFRDYFGRPALYLDLVFGLLYMGVQMAGAVLGVLVLRYADKVGLLTLPINTQPNGNLAGDEGRALFLAFVCNFIFIWVHLVAMGPRFGIVIKTIASPLVIGIAYGGVVILSVYWGTGTVCNFAIDLALATLLSGNSTRFLWISAVAQILGAVAALLVFMASTWLDFRIEHLMHHGVKNMDHVRENSLRDVFMIVNERGSHMMDDIENSEPLIDPHDVAPTQIAANKLVHRAHTHTHHSHVHAAAATTANL